MSAKHTPGPWAWDDSRHFLRAANPDPSTSAVHTILDVGVFIGYIGSDPDVTRAEGEANLTLIVAAPDMLQALYKCAATFADVARFLELIGKDVGAEACRFAEREASAVIAKATGEAP